MMSRQSNSELNPTHEPTVGFPMRNVQSAPTMDRYRSEEFSGTPRSSGADSEVFYGNRELRDAIDRVRDADRDNTDAAISAVKHLLKGNCDPCISLRQVGYHLLVPPLHYAIWTGNPTLVEAIIEEDPSYLNMPDDADGQAPLYWGCENNKPEVVRLLLAKGSDPNQKDRFGNTPLHIAAALGHLQCVELMVQIGRAKPNALNCEHETPLMSAMLRNRPNCIEYLRQNGGLLDEETPALQARPRFERSVSNFLTIAAKLPRLVTAAASLDLERTLAEAIAREDVDAVTSLINQEGCSGLVVVKLDGEERRVLAFHYAASQSYKVLSALYGISPPNLNLVSDEQTALYCAAKADQWENVRFLLQEGASPFCFIDKDGNEPLHIAAKQGNLRCLLAFEEAFDSAILNKRNAMNFTPMCIAVMENRVECIEYFVGKGATLIRGSSHEEPDAACISKYIKLLRTFDTRYLGNRATGGIALSDTAYHLIKAEVELFERCQRDCEAAQTADSLQAQKAILVNTEEELKRTKEKLQEANVIASAAAEAQQKELKDIKATLKQAAHDARKSDALNSSFSILNALIALVVSIIIMAVDSDKDHRWKVEFSAAFAAALSAFMTIVYMGKILKSACKRQPELSENPVQPSRSPGLLSPIGSSHNGSTALPPGDHPTEAEASVNVLPFSQAEEMKPVPSTG